MSNPVIAVENLSKRYLVGHRSRERERYFALREVMVREAKNFGRKAVDALRGRQILQGDEIEEFWALKDISFEVGHGEVIGIIGRNGAGKSTLLKVMSRITEPTAGRIVLRGRTASLLEVGTGFHLELTGRENIFLNGGILGMKREEIRSKFDAIVSFAEVEKFLDTPVKHYSSGMYVRLAFAVAAHLEPEILVVDEVLAVGDATFQQKALAKMQDVSGSGRTVLFVSHNMTAVQSLCSRVIWLDNGQIKGNGQPATEISKYLSDSPKQPHDRYAKAGEALTIAAFSLSPNPVESKSDLRFNISLLANSAVRINSAVLLLNAVEGPRIGVIDLRPTGFPFAMNSGELLTIEGKVGSIPLVERRYKCSLWIAAGTYSGETQSLAELTVSPAINHSVYTPSAPEYRGWVEFNSEMVARVSNAGSQFNL